MEEKLKELAAVNRSMAFELLHRLDASSFTLNVYLPMFSDHDRIYYYCWEPIWLRQLLMLSVTLHSNVEFFIWLKLSIFCVSCVVIVILQCCLFVLRKFASLVRGIAVREWVLKVGRLFGHVNNLLCYIRISKTKSPLVWSPHSFHVRHLASYVKQRTSTMSTEYCVGRIHGKVPWINTYLIYRISASR